MCAIIVNVSEASLSRRRHHSRSRPFPFIVIMLHVSGRLLIVHKGIIKVSTLQFSLKWHAIRIMVYRNLYDI